MPKFFGLKSQKILTRAVLSTLGISLASDELKKRADCCGIIANISKQNSAQEVVAEGIVILQNRGYDSAGIASIIDGNLKVSKLASHIQTGIDCITEIEKIALNDHLNSSVSIGHTRWATCGPKTDINAHPHWDNKKRIALVHNGTIYNHLEVKKKLTAKGYTFYSETDTEVIAVLIGYHMDQGCEWLEAVKQSLEEIDGTWGLVIINVAEPHSIICCRKGSPLLIGFSEEGIFISSEAIAFQKHAQQFIRLKDYEILKLNIDEDLRETCQERIVHHDQLEIKTMPSEGFDCFFIEEIMEQPEAIRRSLNYFNRLIPALGVPKLGGFDTNRELALSFDKMLILGCGSSYNAGLYGAHLMQVFEVFDVVLTIEASNFFEYDFPKGKVGALCLTQSGESADVLRAMSLTKKKGAVNIGMTNVVGSLITTLCDFGVYLNSGREISVAASKSFTCQIVVIYLITLWFAYYKNPNLHKTERNLAIQMMLDLPAVIETILHSTRSRAKELAEKMYKIKTLFVLGKGNTYPFAREVALKLKEVTYIHAEAMPLSELKHGPLALIENNFDNVTVFQTHVIILAVNNFLIDEVKVSISELKSRHAYVIVVTDCAELLDLNKIDFLIEIPLCKPFAPFLTLFPLQLLAYEIAKLKGLNPDRPRNLAKTVTVI